jgi:hypothetical protein
MERLLVNYSEAATALGVATARIKQLVEEGRLQTTTIGKRRFIQVQSLNALAGRRESWWNKITSRI